MKIMIAGASGGIGKFLTKKFDIGKNELFLTYNKNKSNLYIPKFSPYSSFKCNFTSRIDVEAFFSDIKSLDVIINVMGNCSNNLICQMKEEEWDDVISSNLKTVFLSCKYGAEKIVENGHIINISSVLGSIGMIGASNYVASKGGVESFTKSFALECLHGKNLFVNAIALGYFNVGMGLQISDKIATIIREKIPLKEFGEPEEIYKLIMYIISSRYLVGQVIHLNGGLKL